MQTESLSIRMIGTVPYSLVPLGWGVVSGYIAAHSDVPHLVYHSLGVAFGVLPPFENGRMLMQRRERLIEFANQDMSEVFPELDLDAEETDISDIFSNHPIVANAAFTVWAHFYIRGTNEEINQYLTPSNIIRRTGYNMGRNAFIYAAGFHLGYTLGMLT